MCYERKFIDENGEEHLYAVQHFFQGKRIVVTDEKLLYEVSEDGNFHLCTDAEVVNKLGPLYWLPPKSREASSDEQNQPEKEELLAEMRRLHHL